MLTRCLNRILVANHVMAAILWSCIGGDSVQPAPLPGAVFNVLVFAPLVEEVVFRGVALHVLLNRLPGHPLKCVATQATVFGPFRRLFLRNIHTMLGR